jgi:hypothetical protein
MGSPFLYDLPMASLQLNIRLTEEGWSASEAKKAKMKRSEPLSLSHRYFI